MRTHPHRGLSVAIAMDQGHELGIDGWATGLRVPERPPPDHQLSVPAKDGLRGDDEAGPAIPGHEPSEGGEEHRVETAKLGPPHLPLHHRQLMAKKEDLGFT
jgi:hypothetical protein